MNEAEPAAVAAQHTGGESGCDAHVARANIYLSREVCDAYLPGVGVVALLAEGDDILIVPLMPDSAGGLLLKMRNARGDRVVQAQEFFRTRGFVEDFAAHPVTLRWNPESAALIVSGAPRYRSKVQTMFAK